MRKFAKLLSIVAAMGILGGAGAANAAFLQARSQQFDAAGLPFWYQDVTGAAAQPCLGVFCGLAIPNGTFNGTFPTSFPGNYPEEFFYWSAQSATFALGTLGHTSDVLLALEVVFIDAAGNFVQPNTTGALAFPFQRLRVTISPPQGGQVPATGTLTASGPWGTSTFDIATECGVPQNNSKCQITRDLPGAAINTIDFDAPLGAAGFTVLGESVSTFLRQTLAPPPAGYFGDGAIEGPTDPPATATVTGPQGTGTTSNWTITGQTLGLDVSPAGLQDFHGVRSGAPADPTTTKTITITNLTGAPTAAPVITAPAGYSFTPGTCNVALTAPGSCTFNISFIPAAGANGIVSGNVTFTADPAPPVTIAVTGDAEGTIPVVQITGISQFTTSTSQLISGTASDFGHPVATVTVSLNGGPQQNATLVASDWSITLAGLTPNAVNTIAVTATDVALPSGNANTVSDSIIVDTIPPVVTLTAPANNNLSNIKSPVLTFTATDLNLSSTLVKVDGAIVNKLTGNTLDPLADGTHTVAVDATDAAGTQTIVTNSITVDATPPVITVVSPRVVNARVGVTSPALTITVADANPPATANTAVTLDGVNVTANATLGPFTVGSAHTLVVTSTDGVGNLSTTTLPFTVILSDGRIVAISPADPGVADALLALKHAVGILPLLVGDQFAHGDVAPLDVNGVPQPNGVIDVADALTILKRAVGLPPVF